MSTGHRAALAVELLKARRSLVPLFTFIAMTIAGCMAAVFMFIVADPGQAQRFGVLRQKAELSGMTADWAGLLSFLAQVVAVGDLLLFSFVATWVFGREFAEATIQYLLALPVSRSAVVLAKFTVTLLWAVLTTAWLIGLILVVGALMGLPGGSAAVLLRGTGGAAAAAGLMFLATTPIALVASAARGYLAPLAAAIAALIVAQVAAVLGWGGLVPWSIPAVAAGLAPHTRLGTPSVVIAAITGLVGVLGTVSWWRGSRAEV
jgi:ABC-2 type transport system permease protein